MRCRHLRCSIAQAVCGYLGHLSRLVVERDHLSVLCPHCGYESPGWELYSARVRYAWMVQRRRIVRFPVHEAVRLSDYEARAKR